MEQFRDPDKRYVKTILRQFDALPAALLVKWAEKSGRPGITTRLFAEMGKTGEIYYDRQNEIVYCYYGSPYDISKVCAFNTIYRMTEKGEDHIREARYPFDFIFEHEEKIYQIINFSENGKYKLRFRKQMSQALLRETIPVIIMINQDYQEIIEYDENKKNMLAPEQDYILARYRINPNEKANMLNVNITAMKGEAV